MSVGMSELQKDVQVGFLLLWCVIYVYTLCCPVGDVLVITDQQERHEHVISTALI